jgi:hypothetical protein
LNPTLRAALSRLAEAPNGQLPASSFTKAQRQALDDFIRQTGCLARSTQGRGVVYRVTKSQILESHLRQLQPLHAGEIDPGLPHRAANIAGHRDSKGSAHGHQGCYLLLKAAAGGQVAWQSVSSEALDLTRATDNYGAAALHVNAEDHWQSDQPLWLIENQAPFDRGDWLPKAIGGSLCCYSGQLNNQLLDWLAARPRTPRLILFADYDGVGLLNYARLLERRIRCEFWLMPNWAERLQRFGNPQIWQDTQTESHAALSRFQTHPPEAEVQRLIDHLHRQGLALEQESVWL